MKNRLIATIGLIAALTATGCAGAAGGSSQTQEPQTADTEKTEAGQENPENAGVTAAEPEIIKYESSEGWSVSYNSADIEMTEDDGAYFKYKGEAEGTNQVYVRYYPGQMPDEALGEAMAGGQDMPEHTRSEGYFAGRTDVWSLRTSMQSEVIPGTREDFIAVERNGGTLLLQITTAEQADEETGIRVSDALAAIVDSFELKDQEPQTYSASVPGRYASDAADGIEGEESGEYYVLLNEDHTGVIHIQDEVQIIWYSRDGIILNAETGEQIYEYTVEGDSLYLRDSADDTAEMTEFVREAK